MTTEYRNLKHTSDGRVDCEINHPVYGWIPFTADPNDPEEFGRALYSEVKDRDDIAPADPEPVFNVTEITKRELFLQLEADGNSAQWDALIAQLDLPENARDKTLFEHTTGLRVDDPSVVTFAAAFEYDATALQELWNRAKANFGG